MYSGTDSSFPVFFNFTFRTVVLTQQGDQWKGPVVAHFKKTVSQFFWGTEGNKKEHRSQHSISWPRIKSRTSKVLWYLLWSLCYKCHFLVYSVSYCRPNTEQTYMLWHLLHTLANLYSSQVISNDCSSFWIQLKYSFQIFFSLHVTTSLS
jgi:hypothetical protein